MASELARKIIKEDEGLRLKVYPDTKGIPTIGRGRNLRDKGISVDEANYLFENDLIDAEVSLVNVFGGTWILEVGEERVAALLDMMFMGEGSFSKFVKMIAAIKRGDWEEAAIQANDSEWYKDVGGRRGDRVVNLLKGK